MSRSLWLLVFLSVRARYRRVLRGLRTPRGILLVLLGVALFACFIVAPRLGADHGDGGLPRAAPALQRFGPLGFFLFALLSLFSSSRNRGVYFSPAEVDFLFPGPFTRRELLAYRMSTILVHTLLSVVFTAAVLSAYLGSFWQSAAGLFLAFTFLNLLQLGGSLLAGLLEERLVARGRLWLGLLLLGTVLVAFVASSAALGSGSGLRRALGELAGSQALQWALLPLKTFSETLAAPDLPRFLLWGSAAATVDLGLFLLILRVDLDFTEASLEASRRVHRRLEDLRRGGRLVATGRKLRLSIPLPYLPGRLRGVAPIAWRQAQEMVREMPGALYLLLVVLVGALLPLAFMSGRDGLRLRALTTQLEVLVAAFPFIVSNWFRFDFRGDLRVMGLLLSLPLSPPLLALGQLFVPWLVLTLLQGAGVALLLWLGGGEEELGRFLLVEGFALVLPLVTFLFVALENLFFLVFPRPMGPLAPGDFQALGRVMALALLKFAVLIAALLLAGAPALAVHHLVGGVRGPALLTAAVILLAMDVAAVLAVGWAFARFDLARLPAE